MLYLAGGQLRGGFGEKSGAATPVESQLEIAADIRGPLRQSLGELAEQKAVFRVALCRARAAESYAEHGFLFRELAERLAERTADVRRYFELALDWGGRTGLFAEAAAQLAPGKIKHLLHSELSVDLARFGQAEHGNPVVVADEEALPFKDASLDLVVNVGTLHAVNDVPGALAQVRRTLRPDGLFLGALFGGETLHELRSAWLAAEAEIEGGASPRVAPFAELSDAAGLLQRAGFALPVADKDTILSLIHI